MPDPAAFPALQHHRVQTHAQQLPHVDVPKVTLGQLLEFGEAVDPVEAFRRRLARAFELIFAGLRATPPSPQGG